MHFPLDIELKTLKATSLFARIRQRIQLPTKLFKANAFLFGIKSAASLIPQSAHILTLEKKL